MPRVLSTTGQPHVVSEATPQVNDIMAYVIIIRFKRRRSLRRIRVEQEFNEDFGCTLVSKEGPFGGEAASETPPSSDILHQ